MKLSLKYFGLNLTIATIEIKVKPCACGCGKIPKPEVRLKKFLNDRHRLKYHNIKRKSKR